jgi:Uri superfamily endonuclease
MIIHLLMKPHPGTYALILENHSCAKIDVGRLGKMMFSPGHYIYVGSARGPGGVKARVSRHCRRSKPRRWHIDYLSKIMRPVCAWIRYDQKHLEHRWARIVSEMPGVSPVKRFGSSDCRCLSHLFYTCETPHFKTFKQATGDEVHLWKLGPLP